MMEQEQKNQREASPKTDILHFLRPVGIMEARYVRMLSNLCSLTYYMDGLTSQSLFRRHQLKLVTTSVACDRGLREAAQAARIGLTMTTDADAMAADAYTIATTYGRLLAGQTPDEATTSTEALTAVAKVQPITADTIKKQNKGPAEVVASSLNAAVAAATAAAGSIYSAAAPYASPVANNITSFTLSVTGSIPARTVASQLQAAASVGHSTAVATVATVAAAITSAQQSNTTTTTDSTTKDPQSPVAWIVADEPSSATRYFILQGSDNLDHWKVNLTFDPVVFEDPSLGITVHRGVYEAALLLYSRFLPLVEDHIASASASADGSATQPLVAFTGHSLGGSLGTLLMMMYVHRGVIPLSALSPTYTFGAPAVLCDMKMNCSEYDSSQGQQQQQQHDYMGAVLARLGLPTSSVINIMMNNDIVPRAFACDYQLVSDLLKRVGGGFRNQASLLVAERQQLFTPIGQMYVLQPDEGLKFVKKGEGYHPLLPAGPGLFALRMPPHTGMSGNNNNNNNSDVGRVESSIVEEEERQVLAAALAVSNLAAPSAADVMKKINVTGSYDGMIDGVSTYHRQQQTKSSWSSTSTKKSRSMPSFSSSNSQLVPVALATTTNKKKKKSKNAESVAEAIWELMNSPHPLDTLSEPGAYGDNGSISRYHNPDHYTRALGSVLKSRGEGGWIVVRRAAENVGMRYYVPRIKKKSLE